MRNVETMVEIAAPPDQVWRVLTDFPSYPEWNPFIRSISGPLEAGASLSIFVQPPGSKGNSFRPTILACRPGEELRWKGRLLLPGLFDGEHFFRLNGAGGQTRLEHGERFSGLLPMVMPASSLANIKAGFEAMNQALKSRVEG